MTNNQEQPAATEPPFWYIVLIADAFHLSMKEARECAKREMEQERHEAIETEEVQP